MPTGLIPATLFFAKDTVALIVLIQQRSFGLIDGSEMVIAMPVDRLERTVKVNVLKEKGFAYPIAHAEQGMDAPPLFEQWHPI